MAGHSPSKSYDKRADAYYRIIKNDRSVTAADIDRRYRGTPMAMKKQDRLDLVRNIKAQLDAKDELIKKLDNSNMRPETKQRIIREADKIAYRNAKGTTRRSQARQKPGTIISSVQTLQGRILGKYRPGKGDFIDFGY